MFCARRVRCLWLCLYVDGLGGGRGRGGRGCKETPNVALHAQGSYYMGTPLCICCAHCGRLVNSKLHPTAWGELGVYTVCVCVEGRSGADATVRCAAV